MHFCLIWRKLKGEQALSYSMWKILINPEGSCKTDSNMKNISISMCNYRTGRGIHMCVCVYIYLYIWVFKDLHHLETAQKKLLVMTVKRRKGRKWK